jgi:hypothetical protein
MSDRFGAISINPEPAAPSPRPSKPSKSRPLPSPKKPGRKPIRVDKKTKPWLFLLALPVFLVTAYSLGGFFLAPSLLLGYISDSFQQIAGIGLTADKAGFNPFTLRLKLSKISSVSPESVGGNNQSASPASTLLHIDQLVMDVNLITVLRDSLACNHLDIQGLSLSLVRNQDNSYNLPTKASGSSAGSNTTESLTLSRLPLLFSLNNIKITDSTILFDDRVTGKKHHVEQIKLDLPTLSNFSFEAKEYIRPHFSAIINGSPLELTGEAALPGDTTPQKKPTNLACNVENLDLPLYFAYLPKTLPLTLNKGKGTGKIQFTFIPKDNKKGQLTADFQLAISDIELVNTEQTMSLTTPAMEIAGSLQPLTGALHINKLELPQPQMTADPSRLSEDIAKLFATDVKDEDTNDAHPQHPVAIDSLVIDEGTLQLTDRKTEKNIDPSWTNIQLTIKNFSTNPKPEQGKGEFILSGKREKAKTAKSDAIVKTTQAGDSSIHWQGSFNGRGIPGGILQLTGIEAASLIAVLDPAQEKTMSGTADLRGHCTFDPTARKTGMITLIDAGVELHDLILLDQKVAWLSAQTVQVKGLKFREDDLDLDTIAIEDGGLTLRQGSLPQFLQNLGGNKKAFMVQRVDFSGKAIFLPHNEKLQALEMTELRVKARNLAAKNVTPDSQETFELTARINQTGTLKAQGLATVFPMRAALSLNFSAIDAKQIAPWLPDAPLFQLGRASVSGQGTYRFPEATFTGDLQLDAAQIKADDQGSGLAVNKALAHGISIKTKPLRVGINDLLLDSPKLTWRQEDASPGPIPQISAFLRHLLAASKSASPQDKDIQQGGGDTALPVIQKISFDNGTITHEDLRLTPPWSNEINQVKGSISNIAGQDGAETRFDLSGIAATAPFTLSGAGSFLGKQGNFTSKLEFKGFALAPLAPQITPLVDLDLKSGSVDLVYSCNQTGDTRQGESAFLFTGLRPGTPQAETALPLALLTDNADQLKLSIPLTSSTQPLLKQAVTTFKTLTVKAGVAPLLMTGAEFANLQDKHSLPFPTGKSVMDGGIDNQETLQQYATLLAARPHLGLTLTGMADPIHDRAAILQIREEKERERVTIKNEQRLKEWQTRQQQKQQKAKQSPPQPPTPGKIIEQDLPVQEPQPVPLAPDPVTVSDAMLHDLAQERALQVYDFCTSDLGIDSGRIALQEKTELSGTGTPGNQVIIGLHPLAWARP